ncbi:uncharacterized protein LOC109704372 [Ananas comosus]|uniref:Uncharacterized protein LOC109704372 n=1 Tax=Ananas comosus TaxID=4615 RepID=A0A6P5EBR0_ANACO|nr:uncharacterized protein LOC109704372 [Ananas comosus]
MHGLPLSLQRRSVAVPSSSDRRLAAGALEPERSYAGLISAAAPPAAARRRPAPPPNPSDRLLPSSAGAPAARSPAAIPSSHCSGPVDASSTDERLAPYLCRWVLRSEVGTVVHAR